VGFPVKPLTAAPHLADSQQPGEGKAWHPLVAGAKKRRKIFLPEIKIK
jgi:hypothetical protein